MQKKSLWSLCTLLSVFVALLTFSSCNKGDNDDLNDDPIDPPVSAMEAIAGRWELTERTLKGYINSNLEHDVKETYENEERVYRLYPDGRFCSYYGAEYVDDEKKILENAEFYSGNYTVYPEDSTFVANALEHDLNVDTFFYELTATGLKLKAEISGIENGEPAKAIIEYKFKPAVDSPRLPYFTDFRDVVVKEDGTMTSKGITFRRGVATNGDCPVISNPVPFSSISCGEAYRRMGILIDHQPWTERFLQLDLEALGPVNRITVVGGGGCAILMACDDNGVVAETKTGLNTNILDIGGKKLKHLNIAICEDILSSITIE